MQNLFVVSMGNVYLSIYGVFACSRLRATRVRCTFEPRSGSVSCALGVKSWGVLLLAELLSVEPEQTGILQNHNVDAYNL